MAEPHAAPSAAEPAELRLVRYPAHWLVWLLDEALDRLPAYEEHRWYGRGGWGCRLGRHRYWARPLLPPHPPRPPAAR